MKKLTLLSLGLASMMSIAYASPQDNITGNTESVNQTVQTSEAPIIYQEPTTGVEIEFAPDGKTWERIRANGESELLFGDRKDVRKATSKATLRAKANIAKFLEEKLKSKDTLEEITKTLSNSKNENGSVSTSAERKTVETQVESISSSSDAILKGILVLEQEVNQKDKYVKVQVGVSRKTMRTADSISGDMKRDLSQPEETKHTNTAKQYNNNENEIRRSKNYNNF